ncbi:alpha/beta hydrolase [Xinfangfangia sp. CPCC 101601]|uniref:Alpha/beta hydrolase n=1 Tax=Pseudogemmobacter lacusdianii TaxID=3069608 RepID=A0ABU0VT56_9RHOB|nr:alpha/beta hydrolase [Xinfangfangia sp. CPCC 101601]MDQ2064921.1 alpha/beta hydrolase [Xinfangfangia sp. CPCC 101601]
MIRPSRIAAAVLVAASLSASFSAPALAEVLPVPSQEGWNAARQTVTLKSGQTIGFVEMGDTAGAPLILIHGYTDNSRSWSLLAPELIAGRHIYAIDLRGHGKSSAPECCYTPLDLASDLDGFMQAKDIAKADVVGHSLGSMTGAVFAALHPEKVDRLVLISSALAVPQASADWLWENVPTLPETIDPNSQFMLDWYWNPTPVAVDFIDRERAESAATPRQTWQGVLEGLSATDWSPLAARIKAPVLIIWGAQDGLFDAATQDRLKAVLPQAKHETYAENGHNMFWEIPETVGPVIAGFLAD